MQSHEGGKSLMHPIWGKLAGRLGGVCRKAKSEGCRRQNIPPMNESHMRANYAAMRQQISSKSPTCPESAVVDVARMNGEGCAH